MPSGWLRRVLSVWSAAWIAAAPVLANVPPVKPVGVVIELRGELDHAAQLEDIRKAVAQARSDGVQIVTLEIRGRAWRYDLSRALAEFVGSSEVPVAIFTAEASIGVALAGAAARGGCWSKEDLTLLREDDASELLVNAKSVRDDAKDWVKVDGWSILRTHDALRAAIIDPRKECWLIESPRGTVTISDDRSAEPAGPTVKRVIPISDPAHARLRIGLDDAVTLGLLAGRARNASDALRLAAERLGMSRLDIRSERAIGQRLRDRRDRVASLADAALAELDSAEKAMEIDPGKTVSGPGVRNLAGTAALSHIAGAKLKIDQIEALLTECPEILRAPAPNMTTIGATPATITSRWRSQIEGLRKQAIKLERKAIEFRDAK